MQRKRWSFRVTTLKWLALSCTTWLWSQVLGTYLYFPCVALDSSTFHRFTLREGGRTGTCLSPKCPVWLIHSHSGHWYHHQDFGISEREDLFSLRLILLLYSILDFNPHLPACLMHLCDDQPPKKTSHESRIPFGVSMYNRSIEGHFGS
jgi:hypothetical protein